MNKKTFLAFDFGAESARAVVGQLKDKKLDVQEIHRFPTRMISMNKHFYWNIYRFYEEMLQAMSICVKDFQIHPESIAVDTWGVDHGFLADDDTIVRIPYAYRDPQVVAAMQNFHEQLMAPRHIYALTGISMQPFNSLYQLHALHASGDAALNIGRQLLFMPDLLNFLLCGEKRTEFTIATTSQLYNPTKSAWEEKLLAAVGVDPSLMGKIIHPGNQLGQLHDYICKQTGIQQARLVSVCSHDTGSAIVAVPAVSKNWAFISSGTWSLMGVEVSKPIITQQSFAYNFSNEGGAAGTYSLLKNIMGLWLLQQCQRSWARAGEDHSYSELVEMAMLSKPFQFLIDPDDQGFYNPEDMPSAISGFCNKTGQAGPQSKGEYVRCVFESLAMKYRMVLEQLSELRGVDVDTIHIIGGGTKNTLLCQLTADATGKEVLAGPAEGTAVGNLLMQAFACGYLDSLEAIREVVINTFETVRYVPEPGSDWDKAYERFCGLCQ